MTKNMTAKALWSAWGSSPALDLTEILDCVETTRRNPSPKVLLDGTDDARHILYTLGGYGSTETEKDKRSAEFYVVDNNVQSYARQMVLIRLAMSPSTDVGLQERVLQFMDIYGNMKMRPQTMKTFMRICSGFYDYLDPGVFEEEYPIFDLSYLKFTDLDDLRGIFRLWKNRTALEKTDGAVLWDKRVRQHLSTRYDSRDCLFDWDYHMGLLERDQRCEIIAGVEYKNWRGNGNAFQSPEHSYSLTNPTLIAIWGSAKAYLADIVNGPFMAFGVENPHKPDFFKKYNNHYQHRSYEIVYDNLERIFTAFANPERKSGGKIYFLPNTAHAKLFKKEEYFETFHIFILGQRSSVKLSEELVKPVRRGGLVLVEKPGYLIEYKGERGKKYEEEVKELGKEAKLEPFMSKNLHNFEKSYIIFRKPYA